MSTPNDMRKFIGYMYGKKPEKIQYVKEEVKKDMSMRDLLGKMRVVNENTQTNMATNIDSQNEQDKMNNYFEDNKVTIEFEKFEVFSNGALMAGTIDNQIQFVYKVTSDEKTSGIEVNYLEDFNPNDIENVEVVKKVETYYDGFYKYWRDQLFN